MSDKLEVIDESSKNIISLNICNVCAIANLRCHLNLSHIAQNGIDVEYDNFLNVLKTKLRKPKVGLAQFWSNGKMSVFGCDNIENARKGCRILARRIKKLGYDAKFDNFQIVNILTTLLLPYKLRIHEMANHDRIKFIYEPELDPNLYYYPKPKNRGRKFNEYKTMAKLTTNGKVTIHSSSMEEAHLMAIEISKISEAYAIKDDTINDSNNELVTSSQTSNSANNNNSMQDAGLANSRLRKRVFVKTYVDEDSTIDSSKLIKLNAESEIDEEEEEEDARDDDYNQDNGDGDVDLIINETFRNIKSKSTAKINYYSESLFTNNNNNNNNGTIKTNLSSAATSFLDDFYQIKSNGNNNNSNTTLISTNGSLSLLETQDILDDLLN